ISSGKDSAMRFASRNADPSAMHPLDSSSFVHIVSHPGGCFVNSVRLTFTIASLRLSRMPGGQTPLAPASVLTVSCVTDGPATPGGVRTLFASRHEELAARCTQAVEYTITIVRVNSNEPLLRPVNF